MKLFRFFSFFWRNRSTLMAGIDGIVDFVHVVNNVRQQMVLGHTNEDDIKTYISMLNTGKIGDIQNLLELLKKKMK